MLIYFLILTIPLIAHLFRFSILGKKTENIIILLLAVFFCFGYMTGSDWRTYELIYENIDISNFSNQRSIEPGYICLNFVFKYLGFDFWQFLIIAKLFCFIVAVRFIKKTAPDYFYLSLFVYIASFSPFLYIDNPLRNLIAVSIFLLSIDLIKGRKKVAFLTITLLSMQIHTSACLLLPFYFIVNKRYSNKSIIILFIFINIIFTFFLEFIFSFILELETFLPFYSGKINSYFGERSNDVLGKTFTLGYISKIIIFVLSIISRKKIEGRFGLIFFNCFIAYLFLYQMGTAIPILARFSLYLAVFFCITTAYLLRSFKHDSKVFYTLFILFISYYSLFSVITTSYKYIPYTNYINYMFQEKPGYFQRSEYNFLNSPYYKPEQND